MDKAGKDFLINDELERHLESMYNALGEIDSRQESKVVHRAGVIMMSALIGVFANCQSWNEVVRWADENRPFERTPVFSERYVVNEYECPNRRCISATEDVDRLFHRQADGTCRCAYYEAKAR